MTGRARAAAGSSHDHGNCELCDELERTRADAVAQAVAERDAALLRAYHVTLDSLNAPADEWPCNRVKALVDQQSKEIARLRAENETICAGREADRRYRQTGIDNAVQAAVSAERERWIEYVEWLVQAGQGAYTIAWIHGYRDNDEVIAEGNRRRAALGYEPKADALRRKPASGGPSYAE